jgi:hypothetical protein
MRMGRAPIFPCARELDELGKIIGRRKWLARVTSECAPRFERNGTHTNYHAGRLIKHARRGIKRGDDVPWH